LHMAQLMPLPLTVSCFSKIQIGFTFLVPAHPGSPGKRAVKWCVTICFNKLKKQVTTKLVRRLLAIKMYKLFRKKYKEDDCISTKDPKDVY